MGRPAFTEISFLAHVFKPSKNPRPTNLRKTTLKPMKGRKTARVNAYNKMDSVKQYILKLSGKKDQYLAGDISFIDAKRQLRTKAVDHNIVRPLRTERRNPASRSRQTDLLERIADNVWRQVHGRPYTRRGAIDHNIETYLTDPTEDMTGWTYDDIAGAATTVGPDGKSYKVFDAFGQAHNPFWYH